MDRRQFLSMFSAAAAAAIFRSSGLIRGANSEIVLSNLGLRFRPPRGWHEYSAEQFLDAFREDEMVTHDDGCPRETVVTINPMLGFSRKPANVPEFNPNILVFSGRLDPSQTVDLLELNDLADQTLADSVDDVEIVIPPRPCARPDFHSTESRIAFRFETTFGLVCRAVRHLEMLIHKDMLYGFMLSNDSERDLLGVQEDFLASIRSITT